MLKTAGFGLVLLSGLLLTLYGIATVAWAQLPWLRTIDLAWFFLYLFGFAAGSAALAALRRLDFLTAGLCLLAGIAFLAGEWLALVFLPLSWLSCCVIGGATARLLGRQNFDPLLDFLLGAGLLGSVVGLLAHFPLAHPPLYAALLIAPLLLAPASARGVLETVSHGLKRWNPAQGGERGGLPLLAVTALALIHASVAFLPELGHDALAMHLFVPAYMEEQLQWPFDPSMYAWALMPMLGDWQYSLLYILAGETATRLLNVSFILALAGLAYRLARWVGAQPRPALWAVLLYLSMPLTFAESISLFIDAFWSACLLAAVLVLLEAEGREPTRAAALAGVFAGFALAAKLGTTTFLPLLALCALYTARRTPGFARLPNLARFGLPFLVLGGIPYATAWLKSGNPVFPFFNDLFQSPYYPPNDFESAFPPYLGWDLAYQTIFSAERFMESTAGTPGFQWLVLLPAGAFLAVWRADYRALLLLAGGIATVLLTFSAQGYLRYVFAALLLLTCVLVLPLDARQTGIRRLAYGAAALCLAFNLIFFPAGTWTYRDLPLHLIMDERARADYLEQRAPLRSLIPLVNAHNQESLPVAFMADAPAVAGMQSDVLFTNWYNERFRLEVDEAEQRGDASHLARLLRDEGAELVVLDEDWRSPAFRAMLRSITDPVARRGSWSLLRLRSTFRFGNEKLMNGELTGSEGWELVGEAAFSEAHDALLVSEASPAWQSVPVKPLRQFLLRLESSCQEAGVEGRLQVNWYDADGDFLESSISTFPCSEQPGWQEQVVQSPRDSAEGIVFLSSNEASPLRIHTVSFR